MPSFIAAAIRRSATADSAQDASTVSKPDPEDAKKKALDDAVATFGEYKEKLGSAEAVKAFFDIYGNESFKPPKPQAGKSREESIAAAKALLQEHKLDLAIKGAGESELKLPSRPPGYGAAYLTQDWNVTTIAGVDNPLSLNANAWQQILKANNCLHGYKIHPNGTLTRARFQAFELTPSGSADAPIPSFEVDDRSSISIKETNTQIEKSMADNSFSSLAIQASISGGGGGYSLAASAGYNSEHASSLATGDFESIKEYTATYTFPRARVFLDKHDIRVTPQCATELQNIRYAVQRIEKNIQEGRVPDDDSAVTNARILLDSFLADFGALFATTFQLGGQLISTKTASSLATTTDKSARDAMKTSAALSFGSPFVSASVSYSGETSSSSASAASDLKNASALSWSARGGNTLLVANPPEWANSLSSFYTWRNIEQSDVYFLPDLIATLSGGEWQDIPGKVTCIRENQFQEIPPTPIGSWRNKIRLEGMNGSKIPHRSDSHGAISLTMDAGADEWTFEIVDADIRRKNEPLPRLPQLYADNPIFICKSPHPTRLTDVQYGGQFSGLTFTSDGQVCIDEPNSTQHNICRWSLRHRDTPVNFRQKWDAGKRPIKDGDEVKLYCHSYATGSYRSAQEPPWFAHCVYMNADGQLLIPNITSSVLTEEFDLGDLGADDSIEIPISTILPPPLPQGFDTSVFWRRHSVFPPNYPSNVPLAKPGPEQQVTMQDYDRNRTNDEQNYAIERMRKSWGFNDEAHRESELIASISTEAKSDWVNTTYVSSSLNRHVQIRVAEWAHQHEVIPAVFRVRYA